MFTRIILLSALLCTAATSSAIEPSVPLVNPSPAKFHFNQCTSVDDCEYTGSDVITGKFTFAYDEQCGFSENDGCVNLNFVPDDPSRLPHFDQRKTRSITVMNFKKAAQQLMGDKLMQRVIASGKAAMATYKPDEAEQDQAQKQVTLVIVTGSARIKLGNYKLGFACDSVYANADLLKVLEKKQITVEEQPYGTAGAQ